MPGRSAFLVLVQVVLVGGSSRAAVDAFPAETPEEAENMAKNSFLHAGETQAIIFGDLAFFPGVMAVLEAKCLAEIDLENPSNSRWADSVDLFDRMTSGAKGETDGKTGEDGHFSYPPSDQNR